MSPTSAAVFCAFLFSVTVLGVVATFAWAITTMWQTWCDALPDVEEWGD